MEPRSLRTCSPVNEVRVSQDVVDQKLIIISPSAVLTTVWEKETIDPIMRSPIARRPSSVFQASN